MATYLVEGRGSKSFAEIKRLLFAAPETAHSLLATCAATVGRYLAAQVEAGAQAAMLFDTWASLLAPGDYREFALPYVRRVFADVERAAIQTGLDVPRIYYAGNAAGWLEACAETGATVIGLDWRIDLDRARTTFGDRVALQGNLDPTVLLGSTAAIGARAADVIRCAGPAGHIFNLGHGILPDTSPDHARFLVDAVAELSATRTA
jgi:uroporphyrinogen decarboxylase